MRCLGRTKTMQRCRREGAPALCRSHWFQPIGALVVVLGFAGAVVGLSRDMLEPWHSGPAPESKPASQSRTTRTPSSAPSLSDSVSQSRDGVGIHVTGEASEAVALPQSTTEPARNSGPAEGTRGRPLRISPATLMKLYEGVTHIQGNKLTSEYQGKWITVVGSIDDVVATGESFALVTLLRDENIPGTTYLEFRQQRELLSLKRRGDRVAVSGRIRMIGQQMLTLEDCELAMLPGEP